MEYVALVTHNKTIIGNCTISPFCLWQGVMDLGRMAIVGHSFGGATTVASLAADSRLKLVFTS